MPIIDRLSERYGKLIVIKIGPRYEKSRESQWWCKCDCGKRILVRSSSLKTGNTQSCGCLFIETHTKHGMYRTPEYDAYIAMLGRCNNPKHDNYVNYGGRGIKVCKRWQRSDGFQLFLSDLGRRPSKHHQLDRKNNNKGYSPNNCNWTTPQRNSNNTRANRLLRYKGQTKTFADWARQFGIKWSTLSTRIDKLGWSLEAALETPVRPKN